MEKKFYKIEHMSEFPPNNGSHLSNSPIELITLRCEPGIPASPYRAPAKAPAIEQIVSESPPNVMANWMVLSKGLLDNVDLESGSKATAFWAWK